jgi:glycerol-3-phosphate acyltransferase PlsY
VLSLYNAIYFVGCFVWGLLSIGWFIVRLFGYRKSFIGEYSVNRLRQSLLDFGFEGFIMLAFGSLLKGFLPISLAILHGATENTLLAAALFISAGATLTYSNRNRDGTLILTCFGSLILIVPDVVQICTALWLSLIIIFRRLGISGLITGIFLPFAFFILGYNSFYIIYGIFFGLLLAIFYIKDINILKLVNNSRLRREYIIG